MIQPLGEYYVSDKRTWLCTVYVYEGRKCPRRQHPKWPRNPRTLLYLFPRPRPHSSGFGHSDTLGTTNSTAIDLL